jgi:hypothetical protein
MLQGLHRMLVGIPRVFVRLLGQLMRGKMVAFAMRGGCGFMGVRGFIVELGSSVMWALRHCDLSSVGWISAGWISVG